jgi:hypothetical protein
MLGCLVWRFLYRILFPDGVYIGRSKWPLTRLKEHCRADSLVNYAIRFYGPHKVVLEILCAGPADYIDDLEKRAFLKFNTLYPYGYNGSSAKGLPELPAEAKTQVIDSTKIRGSSGILCIEPFRVREWARE